MPKTYNQHDVNELLLKESLNRVIREAQNLKDDAYTQGFSEGYTKAKQEIYEKNATKLDIKEDVQGSDTRRDTNYGR